MSPLRRFGRPGLLGTAARTAVIAGTAQATAGAVGRRQANRSQQQYEAQQYEAQRYGAAQQAPPPVAPPAPQQPAPGPAAHSNDELLAQLTQLGDLHGQGVLTDAEFAAAKAKLLG
ncbi:SHOCT domain-containing protein [Promicromonospora iranensis]|uniref:Membrane protein n=1 Tax=Promicromonospora iranensis TaxID=1105144 RepID=A0ABU2CUH8_9MICO|nr:SHOCT domain-containing protein [Promicromonospora iranensis]MDR7384985.1 putative membrane protein [Promicromonospora iranensis]